MDTETSSSTSKLAEAAALLVPAQEILEKFNYKHKNQHRLSKWWAGFDMLRRHTAKFYRDELRLALDALTKRSSMPQSSKKKQSKRQRTEPRDEDITAGAVAKAKWMDDYLIPKAYTAITQLAADNQFAPLGLLLLGVLAQVHSAVSLLLPLDSAEQESEVTAAAEGKEIDMGVAVPRQEQSSQDHPSPRLQAGASKSPDELGEAVTRDSFDARERDSARPKAVDDYMDAVEKSVVGRKPPSKKESGKRRKEFAVTSDLGGPSAGDMSAKSRSADEEKPRRKSKTARTELDVEPTEKPKKKKKRKKGDEFDDLFSSLM
ncbi:hypothetical protein MCOR02_001741 [Pyricularia oryzae]|uniref:RNase MRP protein 1 RNA binding domain-containing protein n=1 Tax=Pyricularia oryzae TaxID=318829 RepID=A0A4P7N061_PYROR|nr:hypothetical protein MCOR02_001741 [Pyricularia oryzae]KAI6463221.1 hypothetical protein MCOR17_005729 [Pyricularia oryzae]KAI6510772.1 hypothetical protein MCOR13_000949 [Pyricularia oryzae]QBZ55698.1 hypothetical protein PoMZ_00600 [Pyricularia oryzae]